MFEELAEGVFRRHYPFLRINVGVVIGTHGVLVVDTRESEEAARELSGELGALTAKPVRWVVNTHWHWDHVFGNALFPDAAIWGHRSCRRMLLADPEPHFEDARRWMPPERMYEIERVRLVPPQHTFEAVTSIDVGGRRVEVTYHGRGHTDADVAVRCGGVTFMGDLVEEGKSPEMGDSYPLEWPATLAAARPGVGPTVVPGHGDLLALSDFDYQTDRLQKVAALLRQVLFEGRPAEEVVRRGPIPELHMRKALARARSEAGLNP